MLPIDRSEILPLGEYEKIRDRFRARVIEEKRARRIKINGELDEIARKWIGSPLPELPTF